MMRARAQSIVPQPERLEEPHERQQVVPPAILSNQLQILTLWAEIQAVIKV
jgi:hypothetical protein